MSKESLSYGNGMAGEPGGREPGESNRPVDASSRTVTVLDQEERPHGLLMSWLADSRHLCLGRWRTATVDAARETAASPPDVVLVEVRLTGERGIQCAYLLKRLQPELTVIAFTDAPDLATCIRCYQAGADGYVATPQTREQFEEAIHDAVLGFKPFPREIGRLIAEHWTRRFILPDKGLLTESQAAVMAAVIQGKLDKEIAADRSTTHGTVHSILHGIYAKVGARSRAQAVERFLPLGEAFLIARRLDPSRRARTRQ